MTEESYEWDYCHQCDHQTVFCKTCSASVCFYLDAENEDFTCDSTCPARVAYAAGKP